MKPIEMVDLRSQYKRIKDEIDKAISEVIVSSSFIQGERVAQFASHLGAYTRSKFVTMVGNGTDALKIALLALDIERGAEIITPSFSFIAAAEVITFLGYKPVLVDVDRETMLISIPSLKAAINSKTRAIIPVHLFGQCAPMEDILTIAKENNLRVIEDACQAIGAEFTFSNGEVKQAGTMGDIGCISFFPSKNLGCFGDGGALLMQEQTLYEKTRCIANHGAKEKYHHEYVGINSRLDTLQAAILDVKLKYLPEYTRKRQQVAHFYDTHLATIPHVRIPACATNSTHVYHQYTLTIQSNERDAIRKSMQQYNIPTMVYYPVPIHLQPAYVPYCSNVHCPNAEYLSEHVLSLPMHTELDNEQLNFISYTIKKIMCHE